jgi:hypothetical protein
MLNLNYDDKLTYDVGLLAENDNQVGENSFGMQTERLVYDGREIEPLSFALLSEYGDMIDSNTFEKDFVQKYRYKPHHVADEVYGNPSLYYLILFANKIMSVSDFVEENVGSVMKVPKLEFLQGLEGIQFDNGQNKRSHIYVVDSDINQITR